MYSLATVRWKTDRESRLCHPRIQNTTMITWREFEPAIASTPEQASSMTKKRKQHASSLLEGNAKMLLKKAGKYTKI